MIFEPRQARVAHAIALGDDVQHAMKIVAVVGLVLGAIIGGSSQSNAESVGPPPTAIDAPDEPIQQVCTVRMWICLGGLAAETYAAGGAGCADECDEPLTSAQAKSLCELDCNTACANRPVSSC